MSKIKLATDAIVFGYQHSQLFVALVKRKYPPFKGQWALPGGFVLENENLETAVKRELREETGIHINYLEQLYTFGETGRDPRRRVVSVAYFGLVRPKDFKIKAATDAAEVAWFDVKKLPPLAFDHKKIMKTALGRLRAKLTYQPIGLNLLDKKFPFGDLERLYSTILDKKIDRRNFRKKFLKFGILDELDEYASAIDKGRPGKLFSFDKRKYNALRKEGILFEIR
ncbi:MAG TPA: NUDIX hydrolase [Bacteroidetes bacterium]|nr:NUDIX hydrolase [Bacteroidota bacterium]